MYYIVQAGVKLVVIFSPQYWDYRYAYTYLAKVLKYLKQDQGLERCSVIESAGSLFQGWRDARWLRALTAFSEDLSPMLTFC